MTLSRKGFSSSLCKCSSRRRNIFCKKATKDKFWVVQVSSYCNFLASEAFAKPGYLDKKSKIKYQYFIWAVVFAKTLLDYFDRYKCWSKHLVVAEEESEGCLGKNMKLLSSDYGFAFNLSVFTFLSYWLWNSLSSGSQV